MSAGRSARQRGSQVVLLSLAMFALGISPAAMQGGGTQVPSTPAGVQPTGSPASLQDLVDSSEDGGIIDLPPGEFVGPLLIAKAVSIVGAGVDQTSITGPGTAPAVIAVMGDRAIGVELRNVRIRGANNDEAGDGSARQVACHGVLVTGQAHLTLDGVLVDGNSGYGLFLDDRCYGLFENSTIRGNREGGILLERSATAIITGNLIADNGEDGIWITDTGSAIVERNRIVENGEHGLLVNGLGRAVVEFSQLRGNQEDGIHIAGGGRVELLSNEILDNSGYGIFSLSAENLEACSGNRIEGNHRADYSPGAAAGCP